MGTIRKGVKLAAVIAALGVAALFGRPAQAEGPSTISLLPSRVEVSPALGSVAHVLVWLDLKTEGGDPAATGREVLFSVDRCAIEGSAVASENAFEAAEALFSNLPGTAAAVEASVFAATPPDEDRRQDNTVSFSVVAEGVRRTIAAAIIHCEPLHAGDVTPGPLNLRAIVEVPNGEDLVFTIGGSTTGPPAQVQAEAFAPGPASALSVQQFCSSLFPGRVLAVFRWTAGGGISLQWTDLSLFDNGFAPATFLGNGPMPPAVTSLSWDGLLPNSVHYWRVNTFRDGAWHPSATQSFVTGSCP
jgi:hypothetical protein